ncbi:MAG TPA: hypothetical protein VMX55_10680 [candidate division Zixibacteria bacterium]|nr:hypothetical protein [candidate division Zixibacteria bacterium]
MGQNSKYRFSLIASIIFISLIFMQLNFVNANKLNLAIESDFEVTNFSDFLLTIDHPDIDSSINNTHAIFEFQGVFDSGIENDRYTYTLETNATDFYIRVNLDYYMSSTSEGMISYLKIMGEEHAIAEAGILDSWSGSQGKYYINAWPFGVSDLQEAVVNSAGLSGNVTLEIYRIENNVNVSIMNEDKSTILFSYSWSAGLSNKVSSFAVTMRTNFDATDIHAIFSGVYAGFWYNTTPTNFTLTIGISIFTSLSAIVTIPILLKKFRK